MNRVSLRSTVAVTTILVTLLAVLIAAALIVLTTILHRTTVDSAAAVESVREAEEAEIDLLLHERATDPLVKRAIEDDLLRRTLQARRYVTTDEEARLLAQVQTGVNAYLAASHDDRAGVAERRARQELAYAALEQLVALNVAQADAAHEDAERWDHFANAFGIGAGVLLLAVAGAVLAWFRARALAPIFALASTIERFGRGDRSARAAEQGPHELREMSRRFNEMASAIAGQHQAQVAVLGAVAHDLRTPLTALQLAVARLGPENALPTEERLRKTIERIARQITRMDRLLSDFLDVARVEAGQLELRLDLHDARRIVEETAALLEETSERRLRLRVPSESMTIRCDHLRIEQVLINLISNALKYSRAGSPVDVVLEPHREEIELRVKDRGVGISESDRERAFQPFGRLSAVRGAVPGTGLGLFAVRSIVEAHGGRVEVESAPGQGSTFSVFLPRSQVLAAVVSRPVEAPAFRH